MVTSLAGLRGTTQRRGDSASERLIVVPGTCRGDYRPHTALRIPGCNGSVINNIAWHCSHASPDVPRHALRDGPPPRAPPAQTAQDGRLIVTVLDTSGAVVPGAHVTSAPSTTGRGRRRSRRSRRPATRASRPSTGLLARPLPDPGGVPRLRHRRSCRKSASAAATTSTWWCCRSRRWRNPSPSARTRRRPRRIRAATRSRRC